MDFQFASPGFLGLLALIPAYFVWRRITGLRYRNAGLRYPDLRVAKGARRSWRLALRPLLPLLRSAAVALIIVGLARPQSIQARDVIRGEGVDIALALDISGSMASLDFEPQNRLEAAKNVIDEFVGERQYDQIGLVVFASNAFNQSPPTVDHNVLRRVLNQTKLATELGIDDGTAIGMGLANAAGMLRDSQAKSKVVILLTDGVNNSGQIDPLTAADAAATLGIRVYTIGMGRPGRVPVPVTDAWGRASVMLQESQLDETTLQAIADKTDGVYFRAEDTAGLRQIYDEINSMEKSQIEIETYTNARELVGWVLVPSLALLLVEMFLRQTLLRTIP
ncbi:MAG: VWA domain-containing protein [Caldilineaceae bacterium]|nr:VWA domain-containing protein [Caldilineaceae bacterium]